MTRSAASVERWSTWARSCEPAFALAWPAASCAFSFAWSPVDGSEPACDGDLNSVCAVLMGLMAPFVGEEHVRRCSADASGYPDRAGAPTASSGRGRDMGHAVCAA